MDLTSKSGRAILDLERALHQVGFGTGRDADFDNAILLEDIEGEYVFSFESDGSLPPEEIFNKACSEVVSRFEKITGEIDIAFA